MMATFRTWRRALTVVFLVPIILGILSQSGHVGRPAMDGALVAPAQAAAESTQRASFFEQRVRRDPMDFFAYNQLAAAYLQRGRESGDVADYRRSEFATRRSLDIVPGDNFTAYALLGSVQISEHQFGDALGSAARARVLRPDEPSVDAIVGDALVGLGRYDEAEAAYRRLVEAQPVLSALTRQAQMHELRGDLDGAWSLYDQALASNSPVAENIAWLRVQRGNLQFARGNLKAADEEFRQGADAFPGYVHALAGLARVRAAHLDFDGAIDRYQQVVNRMPLPQYVVEFGDVLDANGRHAEAAQQYALVHAIDQLYQANGVDTDLQMALYAADHEPDLAPWITRIRGLNQRLPTIYAADALAWTLYRARDVAGADLAMSAALRLGTRDPLLYFHAGMIARANGDHVRSLDDLRKVCTLNPRFSVRHAAELQTAFAELSREVTAIDGNAARCEHA